MAGTLAGDPTGDPRALDSGDGSSPGKARPEPAFAVGQLVWAKIKNHPWWPGKVYDPARASQHAQQSYRTAGHRLLVAYFGDDSFSWCEPSQLKPFLPEFNRLSQHPTTKSRSFAAAVAASVDDVAGYLDSRLSCRCSEFDDPGLVSSGSETSFPPNDFTSTDFIQLVRDSAMSVGSVDLLEVTVLRCWVRGFSRGKGWAGESYFYHQRKKIAELVDKFDLELDAESMEGSEGEEHRGFASSMPADLPAPFQMKSPSGKKTRSMAQLIAEMDLSMEETDGSSMEVTDGSEDDNDKKTRDHHLAKENKSRTADSKYLGIEGEKRRIEVDDGTGFGKRERKKSKYLSPPYTNLNNIGNTSKEENFQSSYRPIRKCSFMALTNDMDKNGVLSVFHITPTSQILSMFRANAVDFFHLKGNDSAKTVMGFFESHRCSVYYNGSAFEAYQKYLNKFRSCVNEHVTDKVIAAEGANSTENQSDESNKRKIGVNEGSQKKSIVNIVSKRWKGGKEDVDMLSPPAKNSPYGKVMCEKIKVKDDEIENNSNESTCTGEVKRKSSITPKVGTSADSDNANVVTDFTDLEIKNSERVANVKPALQFSSEVVDTSEATRSGSKRKGKASNADAALAGINLEDTKHSLGNSRRKTDNKIDPKIASSTVLSLTFPPGSSLPSKDQLMIVFSNYGALIESETRVNEESCIAVVTFCASPDAENAFNDRDKNTAFNPTAVMYSLDHKEDADILTPLAQNSSSRQDAMYQKRKLNNDEITGEEILNQNQFTAEHDTDNRLTEHLTVDIQNASDKNKFTGQVAGNIVISSKGGTSAVHTKEPADSTDLAIENSEDTTNVKPAPQVSYAVVDKSEATSSGPKRRKGKASNSDNVAMGICLEDSKRSVGSSRQKKNKKKDPKIASSTSLSLTFPPGSLLPSKDQLIVVFGKYGALIESDTWVNDESCVAVVTFRAGRDAEKAFNDKDMNASFKPPDVTYNLHYTNTGNNLSSILPPQSSPNPPLPYIRKNLEMMISTLAENSAVKDVVSPDALKPEARENLVGEMQGLLVKVNKLLSGPSTGASSL